MTKEKIILQWTGEREQAIDRCVAAAMIRGNRLQAKNKPWLRLVVKRAGRSIFIGSTSMNVECRIGPKATGAAA